MRTELPIIVLGSTGIPVAGASVRVNLRGTSTQATIYSDATTFGTLSNPLTSDSQGRVQGWVDRGAYDCVVSGTGFSTYTEAYESTPASDGSIDQTWIADGVVTTNKLSAGAVNTNQIADLAVTRAKMGALGIVNADISSGAAIAYSKLNLAASIVSADIFDGTLVNADINASAAITPSKISGGIGMQLLYDSGVLGADTTTVDTGVISNISSFKHVKIFATARSTYTTSSPDSFVFDLNADSSAIYSYQYSYVSGGTVTGVGGTIGQTRGFIGLLPDANAGVDSNTFGSYEAFFPNVNDTANYQPFQSTFSTWITATTAYTGVASGRYTAVAAVNRFRFTNSLQFKAGSQFSVYGLL